MDAIASILRTGAGATADRDVARATTPPPPQEVAATPIATEPTAFSRNRERFHALSTLVLDTSGRYSYEQRAEAYVSIHEMALTGGIRGGGREASDIYSKVMSESDIGKRQIAIHEQIISVWDTADRNGESAGAAKLKVVAGLSDQDQKMLFFGDENSLTLTGRRYASIDEWRDQLVTNARSDVIAETADALKKITSATAGNAWGAQILKLFSSPGSTKAKPLETSAMGASPFAAKLPAPPRPGGIYETLA